MCTIIRIQRKLIYLGNALEIERHIGLFHQLYNINITHLMNKISKKLSKIEISSNAKNPSEIVSLHVFLFLSTSRAQRDVSRKIRLHSRSPDATSKMSSPRTRWPCPSKRPTRIMDCTTFLPVRASAFYPRYQELAQLSCPCISSKLRVFVRSMQNIAKILCPKAKLNAMTFLKKINT